MVSDWEGLLGWLIDVSGKEGQVQGDEFKSLKWKQRHWIGFTNGLRQFLVLRKQMWVLDGQPSLFVRVRSKSLYVR